MALPPSPESVLDQERPRKIVILKGAPNTDLVAAAKAATMKASKKASFRCAQQIVYVIVGPEGRKFGMHKDHLCATSPYFRAAFEGKLQEADLGEVALKDTSAEVFEMFNEWLYTGEITQELCDEKGLSNPERHEKDKPTFCQLLDVWVLADYLLVPKLQNYVMSKIIERQNKRQIVPLTNFSCFYKTPKRAH